MSSEIPFHSLADIFPMFDHKSLAELADDIAAQGQREPIILLGSGAADVIAVYGRGAHCLLDGARYLG